MSIQTQYIIIFVILAAVIAWIIYRLVRPKSGNECSCSGCSIAETCKKKDLLDNDKPLPSSCNDCPSTLDCPKKSDSMSCGGKTDND